MLDRRQRFRGRVYYGGVIAFNARNSTMDCLIRNISPFGAKVEFASAAPPLDEVDLTIARKGFCCMARIVWRRANEAGFAFRNPKQTGGSIPLDWAIRLRASERARKDLLRINEQLRCEY